MRKIISGLFISLDGVVQSPEQWHFPYFNDEMGEAVGSMVANCDANLFGRQTFVEFASYWPEQSNDEPFANHINTVKKYVASNSLTSTDWNNSEILSGDTIAEIAKIKELPGKDIGMTGSGTLVRSLLEAGLIDELHLLIHPIVQVTGKRLFEPSGNSIPLELVTSKVFQTGVIHAVYRKAAN